VETFTHAVEIESLVVIKGGNPILENVNFRLEVGKIHGLLGPSGSGKTTLMRSILGVQQFKSGEVLVLGHQAGAKELRSLIGYSTQSASIYGDLTVAENLRFFSHLHSTNELPDTEILKLVDLSDKSHRLASSLSGGEKARLALATTLVGTPSLIVLDEPTVGLDPLLRIQIWNLFRTLAQMGKTLLISSHIMDEAANCDNLVLMREGKILATGSPESLLQSSKSQDLEEAFIHFVGDRT
jgi:ABC-2 type transport system ATP-binding protein